MQVLQNGLGKIKIKLSIIINDNISTLFKTYRIKTIAKGQNIIPLKIKNRDFRNILDEEQGGADEILIKIPINSISANLYVFDVEDNQLPVVFDLGLILPEYIM